MSLHKILDRVTGEATTTDGTTWVTIITYAPVENSVSQGKTQILGKRTSNNDGAIFNNNFAFNRTTGAPALIGGVGMSENLSANLSVATAVMQQVIISGNNILIQIKGKAAMTIEWMADLTIQVV